MVSTVGLSVVGPTLLVGFERASSTRDGFTECQLPGSRSRLIGRFGEYQERDTNIKHSSQKVQRHDGIRYSVSQIQIHHSNVVKQNRRMFGLEMDINSVSVFNMFIEGRPQIQASITLCGYHTLS